MKYFKFFKKLKKGILIFICFSLIFSFCSCDVDYSDIENKAIVSAIGVDKQKNGVTVTLEIVNTVEGEKYKEPQLISKSGVNVPEAINNLSSSVAKNLFFSHCSVLALSKELTSEQVNDALKYCFKNEEITLLIKVVSTENAAKLLSVPPSSQEISGYEIMNILNSRTNNIAIGYKNNFITLLNSQNKKGGLFAIPFFDVSGESETEENLKQNQGENNGENKTENKNDSSGSASSSGSSSGPSSGSSSNSSGSLEESQKGTYSLSGISVYRNNNLKLCLNRYYAAAYEMLNGFFKNGLLTLYLNKSVETAYVANNTVLKNYDFKNGKLYINFSINQEIDTSKFFDFSLNGYKQYLNVYCKNLINLSKKENLDMFFCEDDIYKTDKKVYGKVCNNFNEFYKNAEITYNINIIKKN